MSSTFRYYLDAYRYAGAFRTPDFDQTIMAAHARIYAGLRLREIIQDMGGLAS
jgi:hypothetical protein